MSPASPHFDRGDRVRYRTTDDDGLAITLYGFVGGKPDANGRVVVMFDGRLRSDTVVMLNELDHVSITTVTLDYADTTLIDDPSMRQGLVHFWTAEAEHAGLVVDEVVQLGTGVRDVTGGYALAELTSAGQLYVLRVNVADHAICVRADLPRRFERPIR